VIGFRAAFEPKEMQQLDSMERKNAGLGRETKEILNFVSKCFVRHYAELPNKVGLHGTSSENSNWRILRLS
jgi:hypothetical protein